MPEVVAAGHIVVVPQRDPLAARVQFALKQTNGMAMAKPIVSTHVGDLPEILGDTGYLVPPSSPEQLAPKIQWIFEHLDAAMLKELDPGSDLSSTIVLLEWRRFLGILLQIFNKQVSLKAQFFISYSGNTTCLLISYS